MAANEGATKKRKEQTGGASFSPRLNPRPKYPPVSVFLAKLFKSYTKFPALLALTTAAAFPAYLRLIKHLRHTRGWSDAFIFTVLASVAHTATYVTANGFFALCDHLKLLQHCKIGSKKAQQPSPALQRETLKEAAISQLVVNPIATYYGFSLFKRFGMKDYEARLPSKVTLAYQFALALLFNDIGFYWVHRIVHHPALYKHIHKQHHEYKGTIGIAAEYANALEQVAANLLPTIGGVLLFGRHPLVFYVWLVFRLQETYEAHSGYYFGNTLLGKLGLSHSTNSAFHHAHHAVNRGNFGYWTWDWLFGTMDSYLEDGDEEGYVSKRLGSAVI